MSNFISKSANTMDASVALKNSPKKKRRHSKAFRILLGVIVVVVLFILTTSGVALAHYGDLQTAYGEALAGRDAFLKAQESALAQDFSAASEQIETARTSFENAQTALRNVSVLRLLPFASRQYHAVDDVLTAGQQTASALKIVTDIGVEIDDVVNPDKRPDLTLNALTPEQKRDILKILYESPPDLVGAQAEIKLASATVNQIPSTGLVSQIKDAVAPLQEQLPTIEKVMDAAVPFAEVIPQVLGYPEEKNYLFMLQNNSELRPTGGFIGTYGELIVRDGDIASFVTDNIYNLDNPGRELFHEDPPWPLTKYLGSKDWLARDSNWSPDFLESAQKFEQFYTAEGGDLQNIDGVIAVTPTFIASLLDVTGPITAQGISFTKENLVETLQYQVELGFLRQGVSDAERKEVIGVLASNLMKELEALPKQEWFDLWDVFQQNVSEKQIFIYLHDEDLEALVKEQGWSGHVRVAEGKDFFNDYLFVVDANLASLKSDPAVLRSMDYTVRNDKEKGLIARLSYTWDNTGKLDFFRTRYHDYMRVLVPEGSQLLSVEGNDTDVDTTQEWGKAIFGTYKTTEVQTTQTVTFEYQLPEKILDDWESKGYTLLVQKQGGAQAHQLRVTLDLGRPVDNYWPFENAAVTGNSITWTTTLDQDKKFTLLSD